MASMNQLLVALLITYLCHVVHTTPVLWTDSFENSTEDNDVMNILQDDESQNDVGVSNYTNQLIEDIKARILKNLHKKEAPKTHVSLPVLQTLSFRNETEAIRELTSNPAKRTKSEFVYANVENCIDIDGNGRDCRRFYFVLPQQVQNNEFESVELWLFKQQNVTQFTIYRTLSNDDENENERLCAAMSNQTLARGWIRLSVTQMLKTENVTYLNLEVLSEEGALSLEFEDGKSPFLLIRTEDRRISKRSTTDCTSENSTCCRDILYVNFRDVGWGDWVIQPEGYDAYVCRGTCTNHIGLPQKHHGRILMALCGKNPAKARQIGKPECINCSPMAYQSMSIIYVDEDGVQVVTHMPDMSVTKCGCI